MNYWLVTTEYPPISGGGISTYCYHTARMFASKGHSITVFIPKNTSTDDPPGEPDKQITLICFPVISYTFLGYESALSFSLTKALEEYAKKNPQPDVIEFQEYQGIAYYTLQKQWLDKSFFNQTKTVITAHAPSYLYLKYNHAPTHKFPEYWVGEMEKNTLNMADMVISPSAYLVEKLKLKRPNTHVIYNPFENRKYPESKVVSGDITFFGKLTPQKGVLEMLSYFDRAWSQGGEYQLNIIGGGEHFFYPKKQDLGEFIKKKYASRIKEGLLNFEGHIAPDKLPERLSRSHIVLIPSTVDNLPYTVVEAMHMEKVVLASTDGGQRELIEDGVTGFLFDHARQNLIAKIDEILALSTEDYKKIGKKAGESILVKCSYDAVYHKKLNAIRATETARNLYPFLRPQPYQPAGENNNYQQGLLSVIVPYFNLGNYVEETMESILKSSYKNLEILIVDDGSNERSSIQALEKLRANERIKIIHKKNTGLSDTRNFAARLAGGEFIGFLDADDLVHPDYFSKSIDIFNKYGNVSFVGCWAQYFGEKDYIWPSFNPEPPLLLTHNTLNSSAIIIRTNDFLNYGLNDPQFVYGMEDYDAVINLVKNGRSGVVIPECLWYYRIRKDSMAQSFNKYSKDYLYRLITEKHADFYSRYASEVVNILNSNGSGMDFDNPTKALGPFHSLLGVIGGSKVLKLIKGNKLLRKLAHLILRRFTN